MNTFNNLFIAISLVLALLNAVTIQGAALNKRECVNVAQASPSPSPPPPPPTPTPPSPPPATATQPPAPSIPSIPPVAIPTTLPGEMSTFITTVTVTQTLQPPASTPGPIPPLSFANTTSNQTIWAVLSSNPEFKNFTTLLNATSPDLLSLLNDPTANVTVFSPPDAVFQPFLNQSLIQRFSATNDSIAFYSALLSYHIVNGTVIRSNSIPSNDTLQAPSMLDLFNLTLSQQPPNRVQATQASPSPGTNATTFYVNNATFIAPFDVNANNGVIHPINKILTPLFYFNVTQPLPGPYNLLQ